MRRKEETISIHGHQLLLRNPVEEEAGSGDRKPQGNFPVSEDGLSHLRNPAG